MERVKFQRETVRRLLTKYAEIINRSPLPNQEVEVVFDEQHDHYFLTTLGWRKEQRIKGNIVHIRLRNGKIWIEEDGLEQGIATDLLEAGIAKEEIVLAFHPPEMRPYTEFAVA
ncbi:MAG: XisI protein [Caldilineaceae bacterium]